MNRPLKSSTQRIRGRVFEAISEGGTRRIVALPRPEVPVETVVAHRVVITPQHRPDTVLARAQLSERGTFELELDQLTRPITISVVNPAGNTTAQVTVSAVQAALAPVSLVLESGADGVATNRLVTGRLERRDGSAMTTTLAAALTVRATLPVLGESTAALTTTATVDADGTFSLDLPATVPDGPLQGRKTSPLFIEVWQAGAQEPVFTSSALKNLGEAAWLVLRADEPAMPGETEFSRLASSGSDGFGLSALLASADLDSWDAKTLEQLACIAEVDASIVYMFVAAHHLVDALSLSNEVDPEAVYGAFRAGIPVNPARHSSRTASEWAAAIRAAAAEHRIGRTWFDEDTAEAVGEALASTWKASAAEVIHRATAPFVTTAGGSLTAGVVEALAEGGVHRDDFWTTLEATASAEGSPNATKDVIAARRGQAFFAAIGGHVPLLDALVGADGSGQQSFSSIAALDVPGLVALLGAADLPDAPADAGVPEVRAFARTLVARFAAAWPDATLAEKARRDGTSPLVAALDKLIAADVPASSLDLRTIDEDHLAWQGMDATTRDQAVSALSRMRRISRLAAPHEVYDFAAVLDTLGLPASAAGLAGKDHRVIKPQIVDALVQRWTDNGVFDVEDPATPPEEVESLAEARTTAMLDAATTAHARDTLQHRQEFDGTPDLPAISGVGDTSWCACTPCESLFGPGAYLYDLLAFCEQIEIDGSTLLDRLANVVPDDPAGTPRRRELTGLHLDCTSSTTPLPAIDLAIELLEHRVAQHGGVPAGLPAATTWSEASLRLAPEHTDNRAAAESALSGTDSPRPFPIDLRDAEVRSLLEREALQRWRVMQSHAPLDGATPPHHVAAAWFGWIERELELLLAPTAEGVAPWWGGDASGDDWRTSCSMVGHFLAQTGLSQTELYELLSARTVNGRFVTWIAGDPCDLAQQRLSKTQVVPVQAEWTAGPGATEPVRILVGPGRVFTSGGFMSIEQGGEPLELTWVRDPAEAGAITGDQVVLSIDDDGVPGLSSDDAFHHCSIRIEGNTVVVDDRPQVHFFRRVFRLLMVRRGLGGSLLEADHFLRATLTAEQVPAESWDEQTLVNLFRAALLGKELGLESTATFFGGWDTFALHDGAQPWSTPSAELFEPSPYEHRFQDAAVWSPVNGALALAPATRVFDGSVPATNAAVVGAALAGVGASAADWAAMTDPSRAWHVSADVVDGEVLLTLYRATRLARALSVSVQELQLVADLLGAPTVAESDGTPAPVALADWIASARRLIGLSIPALQQVLLDELPTAVVEGADDTLRTIGEDLTSSYRDMLGALEAVVDAPSIPTHDGTPWSATTSLPAGYDDVDFVQGLISPLFTGVASAEPSAAAAALWQTIEDAEADQVKAIMESVAARLDWLQPDGDWSSWATAIVGESVEARLVRLHGLGMQWWLDHALRATTAEEPGTVGEAAVETMAALLDSAGIVDETALARDVLWTAIRPGPPATPTEGAVGWTDHHTALYDSASQAGSAKDRLQQTLQAMVDEGVPWVSLVESEDQLAVDGGWVSLGDTETRSVAQRVRIWAQVLSAQQVVPRVFDAVGAWLGRSGEWAAAALTQWQGAALETPALSRTFDSWPQSAIQDFVLPPDGTTDVWALDGDSTPAWARAQLLRLYKLTLLQDALGLEDADIAALHVPSASGAAWVHIDRLVASGDGGPAVALPGTAEDPIEPLTPADLARTAWLAEVEAALVAGGDPGQRVAELLPMVRQPDSELDVALAGRLDAKQESVTSLLEHLGVPDLGASLTDDGALDLLSRLAEISAMTRRFGLEVHELIPAAPLVVDQLQRLRKAMRQAYSDDATWARVYTPVADHLRSRRRDALVAWLLSQEESWDTVSDLHAELLVDPLVEPMVLTSRLVFAHQAVQLLVHRVQLGLEGTTSLSSVHGEQWSWMRQYRVWEAARRVFVYPENWVDPQLRLDRTPEFRELQAELDKPDLDGDEAEAAYARYLAAISDLGRMEVISHHLHEVTPGAPAEVRVLARTRTDHPAYYYRERATDLSWGPWERIEAPVDSTNAIVVHFSGRTMLFWLNFPEGKDVDDDRATKPVHISWLDRRDGAWQRASHSSFLAALRPVPRSNVLPELVLSWFQTGMEDGVPFIHVAALEPVVEDEEERFGEQVDIFGFGTTSTPGDGERVGMLKRAVFRFRADGERPETMLPTTPEVLHETFLPDETTIAGNLVERQPTSASSPREPLQLLVSENQSRAIFYWGAAQTFGSYSLVFEARHRMGTHGTTLFFNDADNVYLAERSDADQGPYSWQSEWPWDGYVIDAPPSGPTPVWSVDFEQAETVDWWITHTSLTGLSVTSGVQTANQDDPLQGAVSCRIPVNQTVTAVGLDQHQLSHFRLRFKMRLDGSWSTSGDVMVFRDDDQSPKVFLKVRPEASGHWEFKLRAGTGVSFTAEPTTTAFADGVTYDVHIEVNMRNGLSATVWVDGRHQCTLETDLNVPYVLHEVDWRTDGAIVSGDALVIDNLRIFPGE